MTCSLHSTGLALQRFVVKTAAAAFSGPRFRTSATSRFPLDFSPATTPEAENPDAAVTLMSGSPLSRQGRGRRRSRRDPVHGQARGLVEAEGDVDGLDGGPGRPLVEVVQGEHGDHPA